MATVEAPLLDDAKTGTEKKVAGDEQWCSIWSECKKQLFLSGPLISVFLLMNVIQIISIMFVGHLGKLDLAAASIGSAFAFVTGLYLLVGLTTGLETLCGQAFGAGQHHMLGIYKQRAMLVLAVLSVPLAALWACAGKILAWCGQDPIIAHAAGSYIRWLIPLLFVHGQLHCHIRFLQTQNIVVPVMLSSATAAMGHPFVCWMLAYRLGLGMRGVALANAVSYLLNLFILAIYIRVSPSCKATWTGFSREAFHFHGIRGFLKIGVPSSLMLCLERWSMELLVLLSGLLPNPKLETAVFSICLRTMTFAGMVSFGLGAAVSTRVSNELGSGKPATARLAALMAMILSFSMCVSQVLVMVLARNLFGYAFSNDAEVAKYAARAMPIVAVAILFNGQVDVLSGVVRGCGRQKLGAMINLAAYYVAGIPASFFFAIVCHIGGLGLWFGLLCGGVVQWFLLLSISLCTNWNQQALDAKDRVFRSSAHPVDMSSI
ncbi:hypothetical protein QOZ80_2AG0109820 [Eleusine coracana subsp. coracana]|nr:hypothetical protein QOZ80_2AG0109820 [Eleusine coracana subsp. coracana]